MPHVLPHEDRITSLSLPLPSCSLPNYPKRAWVESLYQRGWLSHETLMTRPSMMAMLDKDIGHSHSFRAVASTSAFIVQTCKTTLWQEKIIKCREWSMQTEQVWANSCFSEVSFVYILCICTHTNIYTIFCESFAVLSQFWEPLLFVSPLSSNLNVYPCGKVISHCLNKSFCQHTVKRMEKMLLSYNEH